MFRERAVGQLDLMGDMLQELRKINTQLDRVGDGNRYQKATAGLLGLDMAIRAVNTIAPIARDRLEGVAKAAMRIEDGQQTWQAFLGTVEAADERMRSLSQFARTNRMFNLAEIEQAAMNMEAVSRYSDRVLKVAGNAAALVPHGGGIMGATMALLATARGELDPIEKFGVTRPGIRQAMGLDKLDFTTQEGLDTIFEGALRIMEAKFAGGMDRMATTIRGKIGAISNEWEIAQRQMSEGGFAGGLSSGLDIVLDRLEEMNRNGTFRAIGDALGQSLLTAINAASTILGQGANTQALMTASGKGGVSEFILSPGLSAIPERRKALKLASQVQGNSGLVTVDMMMDSALQANRSMGAPTALMRADPRLIPIIDQAALVLVQGGSEEDAKNIIRAGIVQLTMAGPPKSAMVAGGAAIPAGGGFPAAPSAGFRITDAMLQAGTLERLEAGIVPNRGIRGQRWRPTAPIAGSTLPRTDYAFESFYESQGFNDLIAYPENSVKGRLEAGESPFAAMESHFERLERKVKDGSMSMADALEQMGGGASEAFAALSAGADIAARAMTEAAFGASRAQLHALGMTALKEGTFYLLRAAAMAALGTIFPGAGAGASQMAAAGAGMIALGGALAAGTAGGGGASAGSPGGAALGSGAGGGRVSGSGGFASSSNDGIRIFDARPSAREMGPIQVHYHGSVVYGERGMRDFVQRDLVPLINESMRNGAGRSSSVVRVGNAA